MRRRPKRSPITSGREEIDPSVPSISDWDQHGIIGTIGSGSAAGTTVVAHPYWTDTGALDFYELEFWDGPDQVLDAVGRFVVDDLVTDSRVPGEEGGLIDALTREVDVTWWIDRRRIDAFWSVHWNLRREPNR